MPSRFETELKEYRSSTASVEHGGGDDDHDDDAVDIVQLANQKEAACVVCGTPTSNMCNRCHVTPVCSMACMNAFASEHRKTCNHPGARSLLDQFCITTIKDQRVGAKPGGGGRRRPRGKPRKGVNKTTVDRVLAAAVVTVDAFMDAFSSRDAIFDATELKNLSEQNQHDLIVRVHNFGDEIAGIVSKLTDSPSHKSVTDVHAQIEVCIGNMPSSIFRNEFLTRLRMTFDNLYSIADRNDQNSEMAAHVDGSTPQTPFTPVTPLPPTPYVEGLPTTDAASGSSSISTRDYIELVEENPEWNAPAIVVNAALKLIGRVSVKIWNGVSSLISALLPTAFGFVKKCVLFIITKSDALVQALESVGVTSEVIKNAIGKIITTFCNAMTLVLSTTNMFYLTVRTGVSWLVDAIGKLKGALSSALASIAGGIRSLVDLCSKFGSELWEAFKSVFSRPKNQGDAPGVIPMTSAAADEIPAAAAATAAPQPTPAESTDIVFDSNEDAKKTLAQIPADVEETEKSGLFSSYMTSLWTTLKSCGNVLAKWFGLCSTYINDIINACTNGVGDAIEWAMGFIFDGCKSLFSSISKSAQQSEPATNTSESNAQAVRELVDYVHQANNTELTEAFRVYCENRRAIVTMLLKASQPRTFDDITQHTANSGRFLSNTTMRSLGLQPAATVDSADVQGDQDGFLSMLYITIDSPFSEPDESAIETATEFLDHIDIALLPKLTVAACGTKCIPLLEKLDASAVELSVVLEKIEATEPLDVMEDHGADAARAPRQPATGKKAVGRRLPAWIVTGLLGAASLIKLASAGSTPMGMASLATTLSLASGFAYSSLFVMPSDTPQWIKVTWEILATMFLKVAVLAHYFATADTDNWSTTPTTAMTNYLSATGVTQAQYPIDYVRFMGSAQRPDDVRWSVFYNALTVGRGLRALSLVQMDNAMRNSLTWLAYGTYGSPSMWIIETLIRSLAYTFNSWADVTTYRQSGYSYGRALLRVFVNGLRSAVAISVLSATAMTMLGELVAAAGQPDYKGDTLSLVNFAGPLGPYVHHAIVTMFASSPFGLSAFFGLKSRFSGTGRSSSSSSSLAQSSESNRMTGPSETRHRVRGWFEFLWNIVSEWTYQVCDQPSFDLVNYSPIDPGKQLTDADIATYITELISQHVTSDMKLIAEQIVSNELRVTSDYTRIQLGAQKAAAGQRPTFAQVPPTDNGPAATAMRLADALGPEVTPLVSSLDEKTLKSLSQKIAMRISAQREQEVKAGAVRIAENSVRELGEYGWLAFFNGLKEFDIFNTTKEDIETRLAPKHRKKLLICGNWLVHLITIARNSGHPYARLGYIANVLVLLHSHITNNQKIVLLSVLKGLLIGATSDDVSDRIKNSQQDYGRLTKLAHDINALLYGAGGISVFMKAGPMNIAQNPIDQVLVHGYSDYHRELSQARTVDVSPSAMDVDGGNSASTVWSSETMSKYVREIDASVKLAAILANKVVALARAMVENGYQGNAAADEDTISEAAVTADAVFKKVKADSDDLARHATDLQRIDGSDVDVVVQSVKKNVSLVAASHDVTNAAREWVRVRRNTAGSTELTEAFNRIAEAVDALNVKAQ